MGFALTHWPPNSGFFWLRGKCSVLGLVAHDSIVLFCFSVPLSPSRAADEIHQGSTSLLLSPIPVVPSPRATEMAWPASGIFILVLKVSQTHMHACTRTAITTHTLISKHAKLELKVRFPNLRRVSTGKESYNNHEKQPQVGNKGRWRLREHLGRIHEAWLSRSPENFRRKGQLQR